MVNGVSSERKVKINFGTSRWWPQIVPKTCFKDPLGDVLRASWGRPESTYKGHSLNVRLRRPLDVISRLPQGIRLGRPRDSQIGSLGDVLGTLEGDVLVTSWRLISAGWEVLINVFVEFCSHAVIVWSGWGAREILVKNLVVVQKILILRRGFIMERVNFLKRLPEVLGK